MEYYTIYLWLAAFFGFAMAWGIGANDVSNAMGTSVGSRALTVKQAILIAAIFEFCGAFLAGNEVTNTIRHDLIDSVRFLQSPDAFILGMLSSLLVSAVWLLLASFFGWPVSTTHTIIGAVVGFGVLHFGIDAIQWKSVLLIVLSWILSPILGAATSFLLFISIQKFIFNKKHPIKAAQNVVPVYIFLGSFLLVLFTLFTSNPFGLKLSQWEIVTIAVCTSTICFFIGRFSIERLHTALTQNKKATKRSQYYHVEKIFGILMLFTACAMAFAHGSNDVANAIAPVAAIAEMVQHPGSLELNPIVPLWVLFIGGSGIVLGLATYGYRVMATVGSGITQLTPSRGFCATLAAAFVVVLASGIGFPISTTHTLVGGILGVGLARGIAALNLKVISQIFISWIFTLPAGAILSILFFLILQKIFL